MQYEVVTTETFDRWFDGLRDADAVSAIRKGIAKLGGGLFGNTKSVGDGLSEMKIDVGAGYRVYFVTRRRTIIVLLMGGNKKSQDADIKLAKKMAGDVV